MRGLHVIEPGFLTTVQDLGRFGVAHLGVSPCGAADALSLRVGNRLVGNRDSAPGLEMTIAGGIFEFEQEIVFALTGSDFGAAFDTRPVAPWMAVRAHAGARLRVGRARGGARAYLCVSGGIVVEEFLGSASTDLRAGFGGFEGRALRAGDTIQIGRSAKPPLDVDARPLRYYASGSTLRVTCGPQECVFPPARMERLCAGAYTVRDDSNRLGIRLSGERLSPAGQQQLLTEGVSLGAVQIPPDGEPIILFVDQQTTGGYPKLANVILADLPRVGQLVPHGTVRFAEVDPATARAALFEREARLAAVLGDGS